MNIILNAVCFVVPFVLLEIYGKHWNLLKNYIYRRIFLGMSLGFLVLGMACLMFGVELVISRVPLESEAAFIYCLFGAVLGFMMFVLSLAREAFVKRW